MTTTQINAEIHRNLGYLADNDAYLQKALDFLRKLSKQKQNDAQAMRTKKIHIEDETLPTDKYLGLFSSSSREDDEKQREVYLRKKYNKYL